MRVQSGLLFILTLSILTLRGARAEEVLKIGWIGPLTGRAAVLGVDAVPAMEIAAAELNAVSSTKIKLLVEDDNYETSKTLAAYQRIVHEQGARIVFVFTYGGLFALTQRSAADGVVLIDTLDCDEKIAALPENIICISKSTENLGDVIAQAALDRNELPGGMIYYNSDPFMGTVADAAVAYLKKHGATMAYAEGYNAGATDFRTMLLKAHTKGVKSLFFFGYDEMGLAMKQARENGFREQFYTLNTISSPGFRASAQGAENGSIVSTYRAPRTPAYAEFVAKFKAKTGREISFEVSTVPSYDTVKIIGSKLKPLESSKVSAKDVQAILYGVKGYQGLSGEITVDPDGACRSLKNAPYRIENDEWKKI